MLKFFDAYVGCYVSKTKLRLWCCQPNVQAQIFSSYVDFIRLQVVEWIAISDGKNFTEFKLPEYC